MSATKPFYEQLLEQTEFDKQYFLSAPIIGDVLMGNFDLNTYIAFLNQAFHHVKHTVSLLSSAQENLRDDQHWMSNTLSEYMAEEQGHEEWILDDIQACGFDRMSFANGPAPSSTQAMISYLYDYISVHNAFGVFGMVLVLEGTSSSLASEVAKIVQKELSLPDTAMTYLTTHGELDQDHISYFEQAMNRVTNLDDQAAIIEVANRMYRLYGDVYRDIPNEALLIARVA
ncbi:MAG: TenA family transcriptional regulator [Pseudohongiellaceae bacterium]